MELKASLPVQIVETFPSAVYRGQVYTQHAILALEGATEFNVYDPGRIISPVMVETDKLVELFVFIAVVIQSPEKERDIKFDNEEQPVFRGLVVDLNQDGDRGTLDVGIGLIRFDPRDADEPVGIGDHLQITRCTIHLTDVEGSQDYDDEYDFYLDRLSNGDPEERRAAARHLGTLGSELGLDELIAALQDDEDSGVRTEAATALGRIGMAARAPGEERDPRIMENLQEVTNDENDTVAEAASLAVEDIEKSDQDHHHSRDW